MKTTLKTGIIPFVLVLAGVAQAKELRNQRREVRQDKRISQGVESGQLTEKEAQHLQAGQARVDAAQEKAAADGTVSKKEKKHLEHMQDRQSRKIFRQKHDRQKK